VHFEPTDADFAQVVQSFRVKPFSGFARLPSVISVQVVHRVASMTWMCPLPQETDKTMAMTLVAIHGAPDALRLDNGPEWVSAAVRAWAAQHGVQRRFIQLGKPTQNADIERVNGPYRTEVLDA